MALLVARPIWKAQLNWGAAAGWLLGPLEGSETPTKPAKSRIREFLLLPPSALAPKASVESLKK
jgi:hypothetical protein